MVACLLLDGRPETQTGLELGKQASNSPDQCGSCLYVAAAQEVPC